MEYLPITTRPLPSSPAIPINPNNMKTDTETIRSSSSSNICGSSVMFCSHKLKLRKSSVILTHEGYIFERVRTALISISIIRAYVRFTKAVIIYHLLPLFICSSFYMLMLTAPHCFIESCLGFNE